MITRMCRGCLESYGWNTPAFRIFGESCHCCLNNCTTVFMMSGDMIDRLNQEARQAEEDKK